MNNVKWATKRLKYLSSPEANSFVDGPFGSDLKNEDYQENGIPLIQLNNISANGQHLIKNTKFVSQEKSIKLSRHIIKPSEIVIAKMAEPVARAAQVSNEFDKYVIVADCVKLAVNENKVYAPFLIYAINSPDFRKRAELEATGTTRLRVNLSTIKDLKVLIPNLEYQRAIVHYLNMKVPQIDLLIEKKQKLIVRLQENRQSLIDEAVTKGLKREVPMKDSGIEWLGAVPANWELKKLKWNVSKIGSGKTPKGGAEVYSDTGVSFLRSQNVHNEGLRLEDVVYIDHSIDEEMKNTRIQPLDVLLNITGASLGRSCIVPKDFSTANVNQHVCIIRTKQKNVQPEFLSFIMKSSYIQTQIFLSENGVSREGLNFVQISNLLTIIPPLEEQNEISEHLTNYLEKVENLLAKISNQIERLQEYRQALISEVVTGKIDVREYAKEV